MNMQESTPHQIKLCSCPQKVTYFSFLFLHRSSYVRVQISKIWFHKFHSRLYDNIFIGTFLFHMNVISCFKNLSGKTHEELEIPWWLEFSITWQGDNMNPFWDIKVLNTLNLQMGKGRMRVCICTQVDKSRNFFFF